jgi:hypothetical protein
MGLAPALTIAFMAAIGVIAAVGALVLAYKNLGRPAALNLQYLTFEFKEGFAPKLDLSSPSPLPLHSAAPEPEPEPEPPPPPPPPEPRLELALLAQGAPGRLRVPVNLTYGRILELGLPLRVSTEGGCDLDRVKLRVSMPNDVTYGASLERLSDGPFGIPGAKVAYSTADSLTFIDIDLPHVPAETVAEFAIPVCVKRAVERAFTFKVAVSSEALGEVLRTYDVELVGPREDAIAGEDGWLVFRPDEADRIMDERLPLDRIARFLPA